MKWHSNIKVSDVPIYTSRGMIIGRPYAAPAYGFTTDDLEKQGLVGVYDQEQVLQCSGSIEAEFELIALDKIVKSMEPPESDLDDRIKETQRASPAKNPAKYRARWVGTRYVYDRIDE